MQEREEEGRGERVEEREGVEESVWSSIISNIMSFRR